MPHESEPQTDAPPQPGSPPVHEPADAARAPVESAGDGALRAIDAAERRVRSLGEAAASGVNDAAALALRRVRLAKLKALLAERANQLVQIKEALEARAAQVQAQAQALAQAQAEASARARTEAPAPPARETDHDTAHLIAAAAALDAQRGQLDAERAALQRDRAALDRAARALDRQRAARGASLLVAAGAVTLTALGALSWFVAGQVVQPVYLASVSLAAENPEQSLDDEQVEAWQAHVAAMPEDPQLLDAAAERFRQRGMTDLAQPGALVLRLKKDLDARTDEPGVVRFTLRGQGRTRVERELEALAGACVSLANDTRASRRDGAATILASASKADAEPIEDPRVAAFSAILGGLAALTLLCGAAAWRGLVQKRRAFEARMARAESDDDML